MNKNIGYDADFDFDYLFKIVILGDSGVGKTNIISRYANNEFNFETKSTIGVEFHTKLINYNDKIIKLQFWDTAGQERYRSITSAYYKRAQGILLAYDITNQSSFDHVHNWIDEIYSNVGTNIPILLVGNKSDLNYKRSISSDNALQLANQYNVTFIEMSAMANVGVDSGVIKLVEKIYEINKEKVKIKTINDKPIPINIRLDSMKNINKKKSCC